MKPSSATERERIADFLRVLDKVQPALRLDAATGKSILVTTGAATPLYVDDLRALVSESVANEIHAPINHEMEPHCIGCWVIRWTDEGLIAKCNECGEKKDLLPSLSKALAPIRYAVDGASEGYVSVYAEPDGEWVKWADVKDSFARSATAKLPPEANELAGMARDARRYRWLRTGSTATEAAHLGSFHEGLKNGDDLDAACDAAVRLDGYVAAGKRCSACEGSGKKEYTPDHPENCGLCGGSGWLYERGGDIEEGKKS